MFRKNYLKITVLFAFCFVMTILYAGNDEEFFLQGNNYYHAQEYGKAFDTYTKIAHKGRAVLYNMGNCLFHQQDYSRALVYWSRAQVGSSSIEYKAIMHNKELVLKKLGKSIPTSWMYTIDSAVESTLPYLSLLLWQLFFLLFWWLFTLLVITKKPLKYRKIIHCGLGGYVVILGTLLGGHYLYHTVPHAIVVKKDAHIFAGPDKNFPVLSGIAYADNARIKEVRQEWYKIQYAGMIGWVEADVVQII
jgi:tetratricopeptide (TPR) repeat protein